MKRLLWVAIPIVFAVAAILLWPGGDRGPTPLSYGRDSCARCRMPISRPGFGGQLRDRAGVRSTYDDVGCLLLAIGDQRGEVPGAWVEDHDGAGLVPLRQAHLVRGRFETPMGYGVLAFASDAGAKKFAAQSGGEVVALDAVLRDRAAWSHGAAAAAAGAPGMAPLRATPGQKRPLGDAALRAGKAVYLRECAGCHGERGDGDGPATPFLDPRPRDFTKAIFKLRSTPSGTPPATADILATIDRGIPGSAMPSFSFLSEDERRQAAAYVLERADLLDGPEPAPIADPGAPAPATPETVARGKQVYEQMQCAACHGATGKGDGPSARALKDDDGRDIPVRDFTGGAFRGGGERLDLYRRFVAGMDGTPMPSYGDNVQGADRWALVDYVQSLRVTPPTSALPADPILAGRVVAEKYSCRGCHVLDDGRGSNVGPDLRVAGQKLSPAWVRTWLRDPRAYGKVYPWRVQRMPRLPLAEDEVDVLARYLAAMGHRADAPPPLPDATRFPADVLALGKNIFVLRCTECHTLGDVIVTPAAKQQGPDLARVAPRVDFAWATKWITDPRKLDPKTKMTVPGITPAQVEAVRAFVWKTSMEVNHLHAGAAPPPTGDATAAR